MLLAAAQCTLVTNSRSADFFLLSTGTIKTQSKVSQFFKTLGNVQGEKDQFK